MNETKHIAFLFILLLLANCAKLPNTGVDGTSASDSAQDLAIEGTWITPCFLDVTTDRAKRIMMTVEADGAAEIVTNIYTGNQCITVAIQSTVLVTYSLAATKTSVFNVDFAIDDSSVVTEEAMTLNAANTCDKNTWADNTVIDVWRDDFCFNLPMAGASRYQIGKIDGNKLYLGDTSFAGKDAKSSSKRPVALSEVYYEKL